jgi:hypothetical protein
MKVTISGRVHASGVSQKSGTAWVSLLQDGERDLVSIYGMFPPAPMVGEEITVTGTVRAFDGRLSVKAV